MSDLRGKVAVVTGAGRGIGRACAELLGRHGGTVVLTARSEAEIEAVAAGLRDGGGEALAVAGDVTQEAFVAKLFATVRERFGRLDILVNNAGMAPFGTIEEMEVEKFRACLELNVVAVFLCMQQAVRLMKENGGTGKIINVGSVRSHWTEGGGGGAYNASKYGVKGLTETVARQLHGSGLNIAVGMVCPGVVDTSLTNPKGEARPDWLRPETVAEAVLHAVTAPANINVYDVTLFSTTQKPW